MVALFMQIATVMSMEGMIIVFNEDDPSNPSPKALRIAKRTTVFYTLFVFVI